MFDLRLYRDFVSYVAVTFIIPNVAPFESGGQYLLYDIIYI